MKRCAALFLAVLLCGVLTGCAPRPEKGQALVEEKGVKVTYTGMEQAEDGDVALHLAVENNSGQPIVVNVQEFSANRCQMAAFFASEVAAGETSHAVLRIPAGPSLLRERLAAAVLTALILLTIGFSWWFSRQHFYPYPAYNTGTEYGAGYNE